MCRKHLNKLFALCLLLPALAQALPEDFSQEVVIVSDRAEIDRQAGVVIYQGEVVLTQGTLRIESDRLTVISNEGQMEKATAEGKPARYQQQISPDTPLTHAHARRIEYFAANQEAILTGEAVLRQDSNEITGERIRYDMNTEVISAGQPAGEGEKPARIRVIFQPKESSPAATGNSPAIRTPAEPTPAETQP